MIGDSAILMLMLRIGMHVCIIFFLAIIVTYLWRHRTEQEDMNQPYDTEENIKLNDHHDPSEHNLIQ